MTMQTQSDTILLIGESGVGKTHYGAQLLKRLMKGDGALRMNGAATNIEPFEATLESLNEGKSASHTATATYVDSIWPIVDCSGRIAELVWPDYGGEQVEHITSTRTVTHAWRARIATAPAWLLFVRLQTTRVADDIFSKPLNSLKDSSPSVHAPELSDQARLIELLQILLYVRASGHGGAAMPRLAVALSCWDEVEMTTTPHEALSKHLPLFYEFVVSNWPDLHVVGLSALERPLDPNVKDDEYIARGSEHFGFTISDVGDRSTDLTLPIELLIADAD
jgi:hypothetical protein